MSVTGLPKRVTNGQYEPSGDEMSTELWGCRWNPTVHIVINCDKIPLCTVIIGAEKMWESVPKVHRSCSDLNATNTRLPVTLRYTWHVTRVQKCDMTSYVPTVSNCIIISIIIIYLKPVPLNTLHYLYCPTPVTPSHHIYRQHAMARC